MNVEIIETCLLLRRLLFIERKKIMNSGYSLDEFILVISDWIVALSVVTFLKEKINY